jgi:hypothetical protein
MTRPIGRYLGVLSIEMIMSRLEIIAALGSRFSRKTLIVASVCGGILLFAGILLLILQATNSAQDREAMERCTDRQVMAGVSYSLAEKRCKDLVDMPQRVPRALIIQFTRNSGSASNALRRKAVAFLCWRASYEFEQPSSPAALVQPSRRVTGEASSTAAARERRGAGHRRFPDCSYREK